MHTVSVVLCTYNGIKYIREQLDSILRQTYPIYEIIIQDDRSTDGTAVVIMEYTKKHPEIKYYQNQSTRGVNGNFFSAILLTSGDYIALSDQDDIWHPDKLEKQMHSIGENLLCSHKDNYISEENCFINNDDRPRNVDLLRLFFSGLPGHSFVFSRKLLAIIPENSPLYSRYYYDVAFCLAAAAAGGLVYLDEALVDFRRHSQALTYHDTSNFLPTIKNAWNMLFTSIKQYPQARKNALLDFTIKLDYFQSLKCQTPERCKIINFLKIEIKEGILAFFELQFFFVRNTGRLFQTPGCSIVKILRSFLFPVMQYYYYIEQREGAHKF